MTITGATVRFRFKGKSGKLHDLDLSDVRLSKIVKRCQDLPGQELFQYLGDDDKPHDISSNDVNGYLREISGGDFTAKDFRTWAGTVLAAIALQEYEKFDSQAQAKMNVIQAIESVARHLGNTRSVCRKCYIHPAIIEAYLSGILVVVMKQRARERFASVNQLRPEEAAVLALLQERLSAETKARKLPLVKQLGQSIQRARNGRTGGPSIPKVQRYEAA